MSIKKIILIGQTSLKKNPIFRHCPLFFQPSQDLLIQLKVHYKLLCLLMFTLITFCLFGQKSEGVNKGEVAVEYYKLDDGVKPTVTSATLDYGTGVLVVTCSQKIDAQEGFIHCFKFSKIR